MYPKREKGIALVIVMGFILLVAIAATSFVLIGLSEIKMVKRQNDSTRAFYVAEAGIQKAIYVISNNPPTASNITLTSIVNTSNTLGNGRFFLVDIDDKVAGDPSTKTITSTGTASSINREVEVDIESKSKGWVNIIPAAVYSKGMEKIHFAKRDDAYIAGGVDGTDTDDIAGIYCTGEVKTKEGEGRITGDPAISENQAIPEDFENDEGKDIIWDAFDCDALKAQAIADGTYFQGDDYNKKKAKYTLPVVEGKTDGVFFFDTKDGMALDALGDNTTGNGKDEGKGEKEGKDEGKGEKEERKPKGGNEANVELKGTTEQISGVIVVVGDLTIKDTKDYDFLFDGVILVMDDLKIDDNKIRHRPRRGLSDTNDSAVFIQGAVLADDIIQKKNKRKEKPVVTIKNATIKYDKNAIGDALSWDIVPGTWKEM